MWGWILLAVSAFPRGAGIDLLCREEDWVGAMSPSPVPSVSPGMTGCLSSQSGAVGEPGWGAPMCWAGLG